MFKKLLLVGLVVIGAQSIEAKKLTIEEFVVDCLVLHDQGKLTQQSLMLKQQAYEKHGLKKTDFVKCKALVKMLQKKGLGLCGFEKENKKPILEVLIWLSLLAMQQSISIS